MRSCMMMDKKIYIDIFAGCGGLSTGLLNAGWKGLFAIEKNADAFSKIAIGSEVTFKVEIESREYNGRWYTELNCWGWDAPQLAQPAPQQPVYAQSAPATPPDDDLPF